MTPPFVATALLATLHLFLIGDAGSPRPGGEPVLYALAGELRKAPETSAA